MLYDIFMLILGVICLAGAGFALLAVVGTAYYTWKTGK